MNPTLRFKHFLKFSFASVLLFFCVASYSQVQRARISTYMTPNVNGWYEYLPKGYNDENQTYPLMIFVHGIGELGYGDASSLPLVLRNGPPKLINAGTFPASFTVNGQTHKFIILSPQFISWPTPQDIQDVMDYAVKNYKVNTSKVYLTGLSMGGGPVWDYAGLNVGNANKLAAIVPICGVSGPIDERISVLTTARLPIWALHNLGDESVPVSNTIGYIDKILALTLLLNPLSILSPPIVKKTIFPVDGHDAWSTAYDPNYRENNMNVYEWMLQYSRGNAPAQPPAQNQNPSASAGADQTITLPSNSVTLGGSGSDPDGTIFSYNWTKISGPGQFNISAANIYNPTVNNLAEGVYTFRFTVTDNAGATATDDMTVTVKAGASIVQPPADPINNGGSVSIPGKIETENYNNMYGVINEKTNDDGGGSDVGWIENGDWMDFNVNVVTAGTYTVNFRVATSWANQQLQLKSSDGSVLTTVNIPQTGSFQTWKTVSATVNLKAGAQVLKILSVSTGWWNINWADFVLNNTAPAAGYTAIPSKIEAENYTSMFGVISESSLDVNGGKDLGWIELGDWMDYNVSVPSAGNYLVNFRVASPTAGQQLQLKSSDGSVLTTLNIPQTGGFQTWRTISATVSLKAGNQTLRIYSSQNGWWNINWLEFTTAASAALPGYTQIPAKIEAENYASMAGVISEYTFDDGGGSDIGWIENGDWMDYNLYVATAGNYTVNFRVATPFAGQQLQLKNAAGTVLGTMNIPQTFGFQTWKTASLTVYLNSGNQTLRMASTQSGWWNINWLDFSGSSSASGEVAQSTTERTTVASEAAASGAQMFNIYPNPVNKVFTMQLKNEYTGAMNVQVVNLAGIIVKQYKLSKGTTVSQLNLAVDGLPTGTYMVKVQIGKWSDTRKMIKL